MGCCISNENYSSMYGYKFEYKTKDIKNYRYIIYQGVKFIKSIRYDDSRIISEDVVYPYLINDMHTGKFLFIDDYNQPLMCTSAIHGLKNKHTITTDITKVIDIFKDFFSFRDSPKIICSGFSYIDNPPVLQSL